ncbi:MAG: tetratricopeptide repeat protein [Elusimicrobiota bacterium]
MLKKYVCIFMGIVLFFTASVFASVIGKVRQGNGYFRQGKYEKAVEKYRDAQIDRPESDKLHFNLGAGLYKLEKYDEAIKELEKATGSKDIKLQAKAYYNLGNCVYRQDKLTEAISCYKKALEIDPADEDAKYNLEYVRKKIKELADKNKQQSSQQKQQQKQQQQKSGEDQKKDQQKQKEEEESADNKQQQKKQEEKKPAPAKEKKEGEMSKEEAEQLLDALKDQEDKAREKRQIPSSQAPSVDEDW